MEPRNEALDTRLESACDDMRHRLRAAGLGEADADECVAAYRKRKLSGVRLADFSPVSGSNRNRVRREVNWFVRTWLRDRTAPIYPIDGAEIMPGALRNIDLDCISEIVKMLTPSEQWLWRRVEIDGARLKDLAEEIGSTPHALHRALERVKRKIRRERGVDGI